MMPLRKTMAPMQADRLAMALLTDDVIASINVPLKARKGAFAIRYHGHTPELWLVCAGAEPERIAFIDTRVRCSVWNKPMAQPLQLMLGDMYRRLDSHGARLAFIVQKDRAGRRLAKLQIAATDSRHIVLTLATVPRGQAAPRLGPFTIEEMA